MSRRVEGSKVSTQTNPFGPQWASAGEAKQAKPVGQQVQQTLFGRAKPPVLDPAQFPQLAEQLKLLNKYKKKIAVMAGDDPDDYELVLAQGTIAMIDAEGRIYVGAEFLHAFGEHPPVLVGALAHEIGHRPKRWHEYQTRRELSREEIEYLCRHEETRADIFAGKALAEMKLDPEPIIEFLKAVETGPHPEYFPAEVRGQVIREAHAGRHYRAANRRKIFPDVERLHSPGGFLGEY
mgnify:CR=1 FL=1